MSVHPVTLADGNVVLLPEHETPANALAVAESEYPLPHRQHIPPDMQVERPYFDTWRVVRYYLDSDGRLCCDVSIVAFGDVYPDDACVIDHYLRQGGYEYVFSALDSVQLA